MKKPTQKDMLEFYQEPTVRCVKCGRDIGKLKGKNCPDCGFDMDESLVQWIMKNAKFDINR